MPLSAAASSHAIAATAPARIPPRRAVSTVFAARSLRLGARVPSEVGERGGTMYPRYRAAAPILTWG